MAFSFATVSCLSEFCHFQCICSFLWIFSWLHMAGYLFIWWITWQPCRRNEFWDRLKIFFCENNTTCHLRQSFLFLLWVTVLSGIGNPAMSHSTTNKIFEEEQRGIFLVFPSLLRFSNFTFFFFFFVKSHCSK